MNASVRITRRTSPYSLSGRSGLRLMDSGMQTEPGEPRHPGLNLLPEGAVSPLDWPDTWLIAAIRREPPDAAALDALVGRYWKMLFARCQMLTLDREAANDLAQETWLRVLRARSALEPDGNFPAYVVTIATNLWRDRHRSERRAGAMADDRMASLDAPVAIEGGDTMALADVLPDPKTLPAEQQVLLKMDMDAALEQLTPQLRDVLLARYLSGESAAEIGRRYGRTEQTISAWVREAVRQMKAHLGESHRLDVHAEKR